MLLCYSHYVTHTLDRVAMNVVDYRKDVAATTTATDQTTVLDLQPSLNKNSKNDTADKEDLEENLGDFVAFLLTQEVFLHSTNIQLMFGSYINRGTQANSTIIAQD